MRQWRSGTLAAYQDLRSRRGERSAALCLSTAAFRGFARNARIRETLRLNVAVGAAIVVGAGLFTLWRERLSAE